MDAGGVSAAYTGSECMAWAGHESGPGFSAQGNILVSEETVKAMAEAFRTTDGILGERLMRALEAGQAAGGDSRGMQSAAILIVREKGGYGGYNDRYCDLRVDDHATPSSSFAGSSTCGRARLSSMRATGSATRDRGTRPSPAGGRPWRWHPTGVSPCTILRATTRKRGGGEAALAELSRAVALDPSLKARALEDPDFEPLRGDPDFLAITK